MKAHKVTLLIIDLDKVGAEDIKIILENQKFPNRCISPDVKAIETVEIGEWSDEHPLNQHETAEEEYRRLFMVGPLGSPTQIDPKSDGG